jgi:hypothetical protein
MRRIPVILFLAAVMVFWPLFAQETVDEQVEAPEPVEQPEGKVQPAAGATQTEAEHTVVPGDTLWDLCQKYLNNPWYWPRVWSYNPEITNPHWIYPGQVVRFYPTGELPSEMLVAGTMEVPEQVEVEEETEEIPPEDLISQTGKYVQARAVGMVGLRRESFVTKEEIDDLGSISGSREEKVYLAEFDTVYLKFKDPGQVQMGGRYTIMRTERKIFHPITKDFRGYYTHIVGLVQVTAVSDDIATGTITASFDTIERGDKIGPWVENLVKSIAPKPNGVELRGYIMDSEVSLTNLGERHIVFIDQGTQNGVEEGNVFDVVRREDGLLPMGVVRQINAWDAKAPMEVFGRVMIVDARPTASTGIVLFSLRELQSGDRVLMTVN